MKRMFEKSMPFTRKKQYAYTEIDSPISHIFFERKLLMKIVLLRTPSFLSPILRKWFGVKKQKR
jgi:hypothetical protein